MAAHEKDLHDAMSRSDTAHGAVKGGVIGAAGGAALRHMGHGGGPGRGAAVGAVLGALAGHERGRERRLRDTVAQERREDRMRKQAMWDGFAAVIKQAGIIDAVGSRIIGAGTRAAGAVGARAGYGSLMRGAAETVGGGQKLRRIVGLGTAGAGLVGTGAVAHKLMS